MADKLIRVGRVSRVNYEKGMIAVTYPDLDDAVSAELSVLTCGDEYKMPKVGDNVVVAHLSSDQSRGVVLGTYWNKQHNSKTTGKGKFRKEYGENQGDAYVEYDSDSKTLSIKASKIAITIDTMDITGAVNITGSLTVNGVPVP